MLGERGTGQGRHRLSQKLTRTNGFTVSLCDPGDYAHPCIFGTKGVFSFPFLFDSVLPNKKKLREISFATHH